MTFMNFNPIALFLRVLEYGWTDRPINMQTDSQTEKSNAQTFIDFVAMS